MNPGPQARIPEVDPTRQLREATARLAAALTTEEVCDIFLGVTDSIFGAAAAVIYLADERGDLRLLGGRGVPELERLSTLPRDAKIPLADAVRAGEPLCFPDHDAFVAEYPHMASTVTPIARLQAVAAFPLVHEARVYGGFALSFDSPRAFPAAELERLAYLARQCAVALERTHLYLRERRARAEAEALLRASREAEERHRLLADELAETVRLNELFIGVLAHDLRNPLAGITAAASLAAHRNTDERLAAPLERISAGADRMSRMVEQLLDVARVRQGHGMPLAPAPADLLAAVRRVADELQDAHHAAKVTITQTGDTRGTWDADRLAQLFSNLVGNALQHGTGGEVMVEVDGSAAETAIVRVKNQGAIPDARIPTLFDPFSAGSRSRQGSQGLGLGLFIANEIARAHGGTLEVDSSPAAGTTLTLTLPRHAVAVPPGPPHANRALVEARERAWQSEQRMRLLVDSIRDYGIFMLDLQGRVASWNLGASRIKGYRAEEIIGKHISVFYDEEDRVRGRPEALLALAATHGSTEDLGWRVRKDGSRFWANVVISALRDQSGTLVGFTKVTRDLTERRKLEEERLQRARAEEAVRLRDEFLTMVSHELKTPLTGLQLQLQMLARRIAATDTRLVREARRAAASGDRLEALIELLLDVGRIAEGRIELRREPVDLGQMVEEIVEGFRSSASRVGSEITVRHEGALEGDWDPLRLEQVTSSLLSNAIKYGAGGPIEVSLRGRSDDVLLEVRDHGPGIIAADMEGLFERFARQGSTRNHGGLGLGLYLVRQIVRAHGGRAHARNERDGGACFIVELPRTGGSS